ncbi:hypothetical protein Val02_11900 [Virgisporangium aliadipatigenens]|uniref:Uncharacterized protein n=1 Tax=Virgisporangium aliadipatigenens TaxID=741659 RepID=A0A8J4DND9_9ACTN|nr:hypothetical protein [Virgisporangium aliadipatigenens]GIJ44304.1 hypothetical protein Val02_11900 [Virgisporangium aliadipatigenens]
MEYSISSKRFRDELPDTADELFWILFYLEPRKNPVVTISATRDADRFIRVAAGDGGLLSVTYRHGTPDEVHTVSGLDVLAVHQAIVACVQRGMQWTAAFEEAQRRGDMRSGVVDYEPTGLTVQAAVMDLDVRRRRLGLPFAGPPSLTWGSSQVVTGDVWPQAKSTVTVSIEVTAMRRELEHGISIASPGGSVRTERSQPAAAELMLWPSHDGEKFEVVCDVPQAALQITNVYMFRTPTHSRVERWSDNAGIVVESVSAAERIYRCNHGFTSPPTFNDLVFRARVD